MGPFHYPTGLVAGCFTVIVYHYVQIETCCLPMIMSGEQLQSMIHYHADEHYTAAVSA